MKYNRKVYLAGPDVFFPDALKRAEKLKDLCTEFELIGVFPLDSEIDLSNIPYNEKGIAIYNGNIKLIKECGSILANITPFRGPSIDPGTSFEIGYGAALGKLIVCYSDNLTEYKTRVTPDNLLIEDFGMIDNLMIEGGTNRKIFSTPKTALQYLKTLLSITST
jgi:nucleoside 2-deoxyribosyltransferase